MALVNYHTEKYGKFSTVLYFRKEKTPCFATDIIMLRKAPFGKGSCHRMVTEELHELTERQRDTISLT